MEVEIVSETLTSTSGPFSGAEVEVEAKFETPRAKNNPYMGKGMLPFEVVFFEGQHPF